MLARRLIVAALLTMSLTGCYPSNARKPLIAILIPSDDNPFFKAEGDAAAARASALGYRVRVDAHDDNAFRQDNLIDAAIASNAAAIIIDNAGSDSSTSAIRRATRAGIPCFLIDRAINTPGIAKAQILADNTQGAQLVATSFAQAIGSQPAAYAELLGRESDTNAQVRTRGFHDVLDRHPNLKRVAAQSANWSQSEAFSKTETMLQAHPEIKGILAGNDTMALGAIAAIKGAHLTGIVIAGFDGSPDAIQAIRDGDLESTALQPAVKIARMAVDQADRFLKNKSTGQPEIQIIPCDLVTRANAQGFSSFEKIH
jgi:erythritol transport system substrate-binding protein